MAARRSKVISTSTRKLLSQGEGETIDFKRSPDGVRADDLVSFANTDAGGSILAGIAEASDSAGAQIGVVKGCDVADATILQITNKKLSEDRNLLKKILAGASVSMSASGKAGVELDKDDLTIILREAINITVEQREARKTPTPSAGASDEA